jgi:hypothetical protein
MAGASDSRTNTLLLDAVRDLRDERAWAAFRQRYEGLIRARCPRQGLRPEATDALHERLDRDRLVRWSLNKSGPGVTDV